MNIILRLLLGPMGAVLEGANDSSAERKPVESKPPKGTPATRLLTSVLVTVLFGAVYYYFYLPALNVHNSGLYVFLFLLCLVFSACMIFLGGFRTDTPREYLSYVRKKLPIPFWLVTAMLVFVLIGAAVGWVLFRAYDYSQLLSVENGDFAAEVSEINWNQIPMLDESSSNNLANRKLGESCSSKLFELRRIF